MQKPIVIAAGGTGGHIFPAQSLAEELVRRGRKVVLMTDDRGHNYAKTFPGADIVTVPSATFAGRGAIGKFLALFRLGLGAVSAFLALGRVKPGVVVGFGGYPALPTMFAAARRGVPSVIHEQNAVLGRVNRWLSPSVTAIAASFPNLLHLDPALRDRVRVTGNPVRPAVVQHQTSYRSAQRPFSFELLIFGGSQGARVFSTLVPDAVALLAPDIRQGLNITQQCRPEDLDTVRAKYAGLGVNADLSSFFTDMGQKYARAHLVISRAGASTVTEQCAMGRPAILIPYPYAMDDHQTVNAGHLEAAGAAWQMAEAGLTAETLAAKITELASNPVLLETAASKALSLGRSDAAQRLADLVEEIGG